MAAACVSFAKRESGKALAKTIPPTHKAAGDIVEAQGASSTLLWWLGGAFTIGRIVHAISMLFIPRNPLPRALAMMTTYLVLLVSAGKIIFSVI